MDDSSRYHAGLVETTVAELRETFGDLLRDRSDQDLAYQVGAVRRLAEAWELDAPELVRRLTVYLYGARIFLGDLPAWVAEIMGDRSVEGRERVLALTRRLRVAMREQYGD